MLYQCIFFFFYVFWLLNFQIIGCLLDNNQINNIQVYEHTQHDIGEVSFRKIFSRSLDSCKTRILSNCVIFQKGIFFSIIQMFCEALAIYL